MADTNVKIKLSADSGQVRNEIKLIDKELKQLGGSDTPGTPGSSKQGVVEDTSKQESGKKSNKTTDAAQVSRDKIFAQLSREATLIRKELQKWNNQNGGAGGQSGGGSSTPPPSSGGGSSSGSGSLPTGGTGKGTGSGNDTGGKLGSVLGKLATAAVALKAVTAAWNYVSSGAQSSASGESLAYKTYGSTLVYSDYYDAKKDAKELGAPYGYDYDTVMSAGNSNMSRAGFTTLDAYESDMNSILGTSKAWGLDTGRLADVSGKMTQIGVTENGDQKKFTNMLAESIVDAQMTGREDEQLQVLETISENLSKTLVKVDDSSLNNVMGLYTSLANNNETLKGSRGASIVESVNDSIVNGSSTLDVLLGWGTDYTGVSGRVDLEKLKEQGLSNPETLSKIFNNFQNVTGKDIDSDYGQMFLHDQLGLSYSQVEALLKSKDDIMSGNYSSDLLGEEGSDETTKRLDNYDGSDVQTQEQYNIEKQDTKESFGEGLNNFLNPFRSWYSGLGDGGRMATDAFLGAGKVAIGVGGAKLAGKAGKSIWNAFKGSGAGAGAGTTTAAGEAASAAAGSVDDVARAAGSSADDVLGAVGSAAANSGDDVLGAVGKGAGVLGKAGKVLGAAGIIIEGATTAYDAYQAHERGDDREMSQEIGGGVGSIAGGAGGAWGGAALGAAIGSVVPGLGTAIGGAIGALIGGIGGGLAGNALGEAAGEGIYDAGGGDSYNWTDDQKAQVQKYYDHVQKLYDEEGNNAAQEYTKQYVTPYLNSLGVSTSITDKYNTDVGRPDFMKDIEKDLFGDLSTSSSINSEETSGILDDNTKATKDLTGQLEILNDNLTADGGTQIKTENNDELLGKLDEDTSNSEFKWWNPSTWSSHATGNDYIPYDNYKAQLHKGEMVLNKLDADDYRQGKGSTGTNSNISGKLDLNVNLTGDISGMTNENQNRIVDAIVSQLSQTGFQNLIANGFTRVQNY